MPSATQSSKSSQAHAAKGFPSLQEPSNPTLKQTPIRKKRAGSTPFTGQHLEIATAQYPLLVRDMLNQFVGCMPAEEWLDICLPSATKRPAQATIPWDQAATRTEDEFIKAYNNAKQTGNFSNIAVVDTSRLPDSVGGRDEKHKPDMTLFGTDADGQAPTRSNWPESKGFVERKNKSQDIINPRADKDKDADIDSISDDGVKARGQTISYAMQMFRAQPLLFCFSVLLIEDEARFIRWDRSGAIISARFNWVQSDLLTEFLWRCNCATDEVLGRDPTVTVPTADEADAARKVLRTFIEKHPDFLAFDSIPEDLPMRKIAVYPDAKPTTNRTRSDPKTRPTPRHFITHRPHVQSESLTGRATMGHYAVEVSDKPIAKGSCDASACQYPALNGNAVKKPKVYVGEVSYLKDTWRIDLDNIEKEGNIYATLEAADVPNTAKMLCAGDVWSSDRETQKTLAPKFERKKEGAGPNEIKITPHVHYRVVLSTIGKPLFKFKTTKQLCEVLRDAIKAHEKAYEDAKVLHRDISFGNILITVDGQGVLIDWDLCRDRESLYDARRPSRTGTWPFMSTALVKNRNLAQGLSDDCESFFWVLIYTVIRYHKTIIERGPVLRDFMERLFQDEDVSGKGGDGKKLFLIGDKFNTQELRASAFLSKRPEDEGAVANKAVAVARLSSHIYLLAKFTDRLGQDGWPEDTDAGDDMVPEANKIDRTHKKAIKSMREKTASGTSGRSATSKASGTKRGLDDKTSSDSKRIRLERPSNRGESIGTATSQK